uniref:Uncharacterized protein n=1 Tax=Tetranychus urticae TaxID=32264 RepID=T1L572_TETUR
MSLRSHIFVFFIVCLSIDSSLCKPGWPFKKLSLLTRSSSQPDPEPSSKHAELCEYVCKKEPEEAKKYCDCEAFDSMESDETGLSDQKQITLSDYFKQETSPAMKQQMCSLICSEDPKEASKYCDCQMKGDDPSKENVQSTAASSSTGYQTLSDYFKNDGKSPDSQSRLQLCSYMCVDDPDEANQYCDCKKIKDTSNNLTGQLEKNPQRQGFGNSIGNGNTDDKKTGNNSNTKFSIKSLLNPNHGHSQEDICKVVCAIEPDEDDGHCGCNEGKKDRRLFSRFSWKSIKQWFG